MADLPAIAERRIGPFPVIAWAGLIGGGAALGLVLRRRMAGTPAKADANTLEVIDGEATANPSPTTSGVTAGAPRTYVTPVPGQPVASGPSNPTTNTEWERAAITYLASTGADPAAADTAVRRYLSGYGLSSAEYALVSKALGAIGPPPEGGVPPITRAPDEVSTAPSPATPAPVIGIVPPGALVSDDGDTVFWTDYSSVQWVTNGLESIRLWRQGAKVQGDVRNEYPIPLTMSRGAIKAIPHKVGPPPPSWGTW